MYKYHVIILLFLFHSLHGQEGLSVWGGFQANGNVFLRDTKIGAVNIPQYDKEIFGSESWINLNMSYSGFNLGLRYDLFNNSNLLNPNSSYTAHGLGRWFLTKQIDKLEMSAGYLYDQIGSGIIFRSFEERAQLIDNALLGFSLKYDINKDWSLKTFAGKQKNLFSTYNSFLKGVNLNGFYKKNDSSNWSISPGLGFVNKTLSEELVNNLAKISGSYLPIDTFSPSYNANAMTIYNTLSINKFSLYTEAAIKLDDIFYNANAPKALPNGASTLGKYTKSNGHVYYTSLSYAAHGLGVTIEAKKTDNFDFRAEPGLSLNKGLITFIPPMAKINTYRLTGYYYPATQFLNEGAYQIDLKYGLGKHWTIAINYSDIRDKNFVKQLYREIYTEINYKMPDKYQINFGVQHQEFNQEVYYGKGGEPVVKTIVPFIELLYEISSTHSIRIESQYMNNKQDIGSWYYILAEYGISPHWLFELSDMYNTKPTHGKEALNYPTAGLVYNFGNNRFGLRYVKQVQGIVCSGGICRLEPAFSGFRASIISNF